MKKRLLVKKEVGVYHVVCRTAYQIDKLSDEGKSVFVKLLKKQAAFSGVEIVTYCLLDNHFHLLIKIPYCESISDEELVKRYRALYGEEGGEYAMPTAVFAKMLKEGGNPAKVLRERLLARMHNLSVFVKELKQRFGIWFNRRHQNSGTLWSDRFYSVLVENSDEVVALVAAYIDLNPVRLGKCEHPKDYPFSNYKENGCYSILEKRASGDQSEGKPMDIKELSIKLKCNIHGMSHGKLIGSNQFVRAWHEGHQATLKGKSKWVATAVEHVLWCCLSLTEYHLHKKTVDHYR